ncbi:hypothetical protein HRbin15_00051 [bacterium HR15]|nr:hypothetical protein HRbin15_00051 [bacterium HR15]
MRRDIYQRVWMKGVIGLLTLLSVASSWSQWQVINLHPSGWQSSEANAIENGVAAGGGTLADGSQSAVLWTSLNASSASLLNQSTAGSWGWAMSSGVVVGPAWNGTVHAAAWSGGAFYDLNPPFTAWSNAFAVKHVGANPVTVGIALHGSVFHATAWQGYNANSPIDLHPSGAGQSFAYGINSNGAVVGIVDGQAAYWGNYNNPASYVNLHPSGMAASYALGIAENGQVGGFVVANGQERACVWDPSTGSWTDIHPTTATGDSEVLGIGSMPGAASAVAVGFAVFNGEQHAVVWRCLDGGSGWVDLHTVLPPGYTLSWARGVWSAPDGTLYVSGAAGDANHSEAMVWVLTPGDVNGDGCIDDADLLSVLFDFGNSGCSLTDVNGDGVVDDADLLIILFGFGNGC